MNTEKLTIDPYKDFTLTINIIRVRTYGGAQFFYTIESEEKIITSNSASGYFFSTRAEAVEHANNFIDENFE